MQTACLPVWALMSIAWGGGIAAVLAAGLAKKPLQRRFFTDRR
jgi:hypothetical protein